MLLACCVPENAGMGPPPLQWSLGPEGEGAGRSQAGGRGAALGEGGVCSVQNRTLSPEQG